MRPSSAPPRVSSEPPPNEPSPSLLPPAANDSPSNDGKRIGERYVVQKELGRGGMAVVYRVLDVASGEPMALKQLLVAQHEKNRDALQRLFESEFRTLAELDHPRVIHVDDYGVDALGPYYTMELLDGGNLTQRAPLPWREACALLHDVCSSLALLHPRQLLHRDVSPHNVRCTDGGRAKLIDFGAMVQMGPCEQAVGTPAFVAPEVAQRGTLDGRTDLFSLGATLYFALTGRAAYPARSFDQLLEAWGHRPEPPSAYVPEIPAGLDALVMSLLSLDPALRPRSAFEVMSHLHALANLGEREILDVSHVYLAAPLLVGREELLAKVQRRTTHARVRRGSGLLIDGAPGTGRSRALAAAVLQAKLAGLRVVRADAHRAGRHPFALVTEVLRQLMRLVPESSLAAARATEGAELLFDVSTLDASTQVTSVTLRPLSEEPARRLALQQALTSFCTQLARRHTLAIAIDDIDAADEPSSAWLASLVEQAKRQRLLLLYTARSANVDSDGPPALKLIAERCSRYTLQPFTPEQLETLCDSIFGNVPYVRMTADRVYRVALGNARASMDLLRYLVDHELVRYEAGTWILPEKLEPSALPASMDEAYAERVARLSDDARWLGQVHALSTYQTLSFEDHARLMPNVDLAPVRAELLAAGVLAGHTELAAADDAWSRALLQHLSDAERMDIHRKLAALGPGPLRPAVSVSYHLQCAGEHVAAMELLVALPMDEEPIRAITRLQLSLSQVTELLQQCLHTAERLGRSEYVLNELRRIVCGITIASHGDEYASTSPAWLASLRRDAGLDDWDALAEVSDPGARLMQALTRAAERYNAAAEQSRGYRPDAAIRHLINYVVVSIAIGSRTFDAAAIRSLPKLLEPFVALSPIVDAIHANALASYEYIVEGRIQRARERWIGVLERLKDVQGEALQYVRPIRGAVAFALGLIEVIRGYGTATRWADMLDDDPLQHVNAVYLRRIGRLQLGDVEGAERLRKKAELLAVTANFQSMFDSLMVSELIVYSLAADLSGLQQVYERLRLTVERYPAWACYERLARAQLALLHGQYAEALTCTEQALAYSAPDEREPRRCYNAWPWVVSARCHALLGAGRHAEARELASRVLEECVRRGMTATEELTRVLALAEARLGEYASAAQRLEALVAQQEATGIVGINVGATYEARTRIAIWGGDREAVEKYGKLTAAAYAHGQGSPLGGRYERLMSEAQSHGVRVQLALTQFETSMFGNTTFVKAMPSATGIAVALRSASSAEERAERALRLACEATDARAGELHLITETGLQVTAVLGNPAQTDAYADLARQCLERALERDEGATQFVDSSTASSSTAGPRTSLLQPLLQRAVLLTGEREGVRHHAAVVVIDASARVINVREQHEVLRAIASYLLSVGDTPGIPAND